jgi:hypothetical protein
MKTMRNKDVLVSELIVWVLNELYGTLGHAGSGGTIIIIDGT